jgi:hypothetical protein
MAQNNQVPKRLILLVAVAMMNVKAAIRPVRATHLAMTKSGPKATGASR